jgi:hypothetical protein
VQAAEQEREAAVAAVAAAEGREKASVCVLCVCGGVCVCSMLVRKADQPT